MKANDRICCPFCGENTVVKEKRSFADWKLSAPELVCALCGKKLGDVQEEESSSASDARNRLSALLGGGEPENISLAPAKEHRNWCRNCVHFTAHPFKSLCARTRQETDPMGECAFFEDKEGEKTPPAERNHL